MLTEKECKNATCPPDKKRARFTDSAGLYLEVSPKGSKRWFLKTYGNRGESRLAVASRTIIWSLVKQVRVGVMPLFHGLHRRTALER